MVYLSKQTAEIHDELKDRGFGVMQTSKMTSRVTGRPLPMYLIKCRQEEKNIWNIRLILNLRVSVETQETNWARTMF